MHTFRVFLLPSVLPLNLGVLAHVDVTADYMETTNNNAVFFTAGSMVAQFGVNGYAYVAQTS